MKRARWLVTATLVLALAVIALGAYTRLTDAGLGCPDWPGCYGRLTPPVHDTHIAAAQARFPDAQVDPFKARNEMVHRYLAGLLGLCVLAIFVVSRRLPRGRGRPGRIHVRAARDRIAPELGAQQRQQRQHPEAAEQMRHHHHRHQVHRHRPHAERGLEHHQRQ